MSEFDRERIEAAVRAWDREPSTDHTFAMFTAMDAPIGFWRPDGTDDAAEFSVGACAEWLRHVRALDAAKPAPAVGADPEFCDRCGGVEGIDGHLPECPQFYARGKHGQHAPAPAPTLAQADTAPAMTLEQARAMCREAWDTLVTASGYEAPGAVLAYIEHALALSESDGDRYLEIFDEVEDGDKPAERAAMAVERDRLRALGVTPAVLS